MGRGCLPQEGEREARPAGSPRRRRAAAYWSAIVAGIAALAAVLGNLDSILSFWDSRVSPNLAATSILKVGLEDRSDRILRVFVVADGGGSDAEGQSELRGGAEARFTLAQGRSYRLAWYGFGFEPGEAAGLRLGEGENNWRFVPVGAETDGQTRLALRSQLGRSAETRPANASLILRDSGAGPQDGQASERAGRLIRLFETGNPDARPGPEMSVLERGIAQAQVEARTLMALCGLSSARSELFVQDRIVSSGLPRTRRELEACAASPGVAGLPEEPKLLWLRDRFLRGIPAFAVRPLRRRMDTIITGAGSINGVELTPAG